MSDIVDVLLATYNGKNFIEEQILSILHQSYPYFRIIIRDDNSSDSTYEILKRLALQFPMKIHLLPQGCRLGVIGNFSCLMKQSDAPYIMFSDQDDIWFDCKIAKTLEKMKQRESSLNLNSPILIHTDLQVVDEKLNLINQSFWKHSGLKPHLGRFLNNFLVQNVITGCTVMINRPLLELAFPIPSQAVMHDWWLGLVASAFGHIDFIKEPMLLYRQHSANTLGARKFSIKAIFSSKLWKSNQKIYLAKTEQALFFYNRFTLALTEWQNQTIRSYINLSNYNFIKKRYVLIKYRLFKNGFLRNIPSFLTDFIKH